jgi:methionyl-tRNA synthetase
MNQGKIIICIEAVCVILCALSCTTGFSLYSTTKEDKPKRPNHKGTCQGCGADSWSGNQCNYCKGKIK